MFALADKNCQVAKTCGSNGGETGGTSYINYEIFKEFTDGQTQLSLGQCTSARQNKDRITKLMSVPLVQGTMQLAYGRYSQPTESNDAEGAVFALSVLPIVHACNPDDAQTIQENMKVGGFGAVHFSQVKAAFEKNYDCMGITCSEVGGIYDESLAAYKDGASPCQSSSQNRKQVGLAVGLSLTGLFLVSMVVLAISYCGHKKAQQNVPPEAFPPKEGSVIT